MSTAKYDLAASRMGDSDQGLTAERVVVITGLAGSAEAQLYDALQNADLPRLGTPHPGASSLRLTSRVAEGQGAGTARVRLVYQIPTDYQLDGQVEVGTTLSDERVDTDIHGALMVVDYTGPDGVARPSQACSASVGQPRTTLTVRKVEWDDPKDKSQRFTGTVNRGGCPWEPKAAPRTWRVNGITGTSRDFGKTWVVVYSLECKLDGWDSSQAWIDPATGRMPPDIVKGVGLKTFEVVADEDFNRLGI